MNLFGENALPVVGFLSRMDFLMRVRAVKLVLGEDKGLEGGGDRWSPGGGDGVRIEADLGSRKLGLFLAKDWKNEVFL